MGDLLTGKMLAALRFPRSHGSVHVGWEYLEKHLELERAAGFELQPEYQRDINRWTREQQVAYVEHVALGGETGCNVTAVHIGPRQFHYTEAADGKLVLPGYSMLDGLQRITAVRAFMHDEFPVLTAIRPVGFLASQFARDAWRTDFRFVWSTVTVPTVRDVLKLYLRYNRGGTPHTRDDFRRVKEMLEKSK